MKTSQVKSYYGRYMYAVNRYGYRHLSDCYKSPSCAKVEVERSIIQECNNRDGYGYSILSYNTTIFTCGYVFWRDNEMIFCVHTPNDYGEMIIKGGF